MDWGRLCYVSPWKNITSFPQSVGRFPIFAQKRGPPQNVHFATAPHFNASRMTRAKQKPEKSAVIFESGSLDAGLKIAFSDRF